MNVKSVGNYRLRLDFDHYKILRDINAAPFAAYMNFGNLKIASSSPERFLSVAPDNKVETKPIKGTMKRSHDPAQDAAIADKLRESAKDNAENAMIVDLMRNDLSRTCIDSSIDVPKLCALESFAKVHHLVSTVTGQLRPDQHPVDLLKSCFPGGSITGAPKIRAMEIIDELEGLLVLMVDIVYHIHLETIVSYIEATRILTFHYIDCLSWRCVDHSLSYTCN